MLNKKELNFLRKKYPEEHFEIKEENSRLDIMPKKTVIRVFKKQYQAFAKRCMLEGDDFGETLLRKIEKQRLAPENFEQSQITVSRAAANKLAQEAKNCKTRKIIFLQQLLGR